MKWDEVRVLVIGDLMLDRWVYTQKTRVSPEAPIPVVEQREYFSELGGAGNALRHLENLSVGPHALIAVRGHDAPGDEIEHLAEIVRSETHLFVDSSRSTTVKERFFIDGRPMYRKDSEDVSPLREELETLLHEIAEGQIENFDVLLLSDYAKGLLSDSLIQRLIRLARAHGRPIVSDPGFGRIDSFAGCDVIKPNAKEWQEYVNRSGDETKAFSALFDRGTECVLVTRGKKGIQYTTPNKQLWVAPTVEMDAKDVTGAGDSVAAALSLVIGAGIGLEESLDVLNTVGGRAVSQDRTNLPENWNVQTD